VAVCICDKICWFFGFLGGGGKGGGLGGGVGGGGGGGGGW